MVAKKKRLTANQLLKEKTKDYPPETEEMLQARLEAEQTIKEYKVFERRRQQLSRKWKDGAITKLEEREMNRMFGKDGDAMTQKLMTCARKLAESSSGRHKNSKGQPSAKAQKRKKPARK